MEEQAGNSITAKVAHALLLNRDIDVHRSIDGNIVSRVRRQDGKTIHILKGLAINANLSSDRLTIDTITVHHTVIVGGSILVKIRHS